MQPLPLPHQNVQPLMNKLKTLLATMAMLGCGVLAHAQMVYPGDADNNGEVNQYDLLYIGYAYGTVGPMRLEDDTEFFPQIIPLLWSQAFPNGLNYAYTDANGNGVVDFADVLTVGANYGQTHGSPQPFEVVVGSAGVDPAIVFDGTAITEPVTAGSVINLPIVLGSPALPATDINGIAFSISCDRPGLIADISLDLSNSWLNEDTAAFHFTAFAHGPADLKADAALTRFGQSTVSGSGPIGVLSIVIEGDLVGFIPAGDSLKVILTIDSTVMMSSAFGALPVYSTPLEIMVYHPTALPSPVRSPLVPRLEVFPNPVRQEIQVTCTEKIDHISLCNQLGQVTPFDVQSISDHSLQLQVADLPPGAYWLRVQTPRGMAIEQIIKE